VPKRTFPKRHTHSEVCSREPLTPPEVDKLRKAAHSIGRHGERNTTMILLAYRHGLRVSELIHLRWDQLDLDQGLLARQARQEWRPQHAPAHQRRDACATETQTPGRRIGLCVSLRTQRTADRCERAPDDGPGRASAPSWGSRCTRISSGMGAAIDLLYLSA
jgi:Phage integrase family